MDWGPSIKHYTRPCKFGNVALCSFKPCHKHDSEDVEPLGIQWAAELSCRLVEVWYHLGKTQLFPLHCTALSDTHRQEQASMTSVFFFCKRNPSMWFIKDSSTWHRKFESSSTMLHQRWLWESDMKERLTCTTLSNMCANGKNEMDTSDGTGTKTLWRNMGMASNIKNLDSHRD